MDRDPIRPVDIIACKRDGGRLDEESIARFVQGFTSGSIPGYQMAALAMAIYLRGMNGAEIVSLTREMVASGRTLGRVGDSLRVDKHSTGGIGDKVSLILAPLLACCGLHVPMISGRGLGVSGGTLDKLEAIPGFRVDLSEEEIERALTDVGCTITGATADIAPADKKLYALRDVTATVESIPLITASILSKKLAEDLDVLVLDVKFGSGAFMRDLDRARELAKALIETGNELGVRTTALLTDMNQPLGRMAGNAVEVQESIQTLQGEGPEDLVTIVTALAVEVLLRAFPDQTEGDVRRTLDGHWKSGRAFARFEAMIRVQGGNLDQFVTPVPCLEVNAERDGYVAAIDTARLGHVIVAMGGGRRVVEDNIDPGVGLEMLVRIGDRVSKEQPIVRLYGKVRDPSAHAAAIREAMTIGDRQVDWGPLIVSE